MFFPPILLEDETLIALDKPAGLPVAADRRERSQTSLMDLVHARLGPDVANVHRLDADTSGVVLFAKTKTALDFLSGQFQSKTVGRVFLAVVVLPGAEDVQGTGLKRAAPVRDAGGALPAEFEVDQALEPDEENPGLMCARAKKGGKPGLTRFRVLERFGGFASVECRPATALPHQVRLHLALAGAPILGDVQYGIPSAQLLLSDLKRHYKGRQKEKPLIDRLALHASRLEFTHPATRLPASAEAPEPRDFEVALKYLRKFRTVRAS